MLQHRGKVIVAVMYSWVLKSKVVAVPLLGTIEIHTLQVLKEDCCTVVIGKNCSTPIICITNCCI